MSAVLLACDAGLAHFGWAALRLGFTAECIGLGVVRTEKSHAKRNVLASCDNTRRVRELTAALEKLIATYRPKVICTEAMSFPRHASSACKLGMARAVLDTLAEVHGLAVLQASPQEVKRAMCGKASASKGEVAAEVWNRLKPEEIMTLPASIREHAYDAAAVGLTCLASDVVRALRGAA